ncbi:MAG: TetR family transcriptional regulator [Ignavibacteriae bacterium]|nr:TetR family transcriptional regulator [Ignavibacteriota bacterium]
MAKRTRAVNDEQKSQRREAILGAALELFRSGSFTDINVASVATRAGIAKGTVYLYFQTKEEIFLALHRRAYAEWFSALESGLSLEAGRRSIPKVVALFAETLESNPDFMRLIAILHTTLEQNIPLEIALEFKRELRDGALRIGSLLEQNLDFLKPGEGTTLFIRTQGLIIGLQHIANPSNVVAEALDREDLTLFDVNFAAALTETLSILLIGLKSIPRG